MSKEEERIKYFSSDVDSTLVKIIVVAVVFHFLVVAFFIGLHYVNLKPEPEQIPVFEMVQVAQPKPPAPKPVQPKPPEPKPKTEPPKPKVNKELPPEIKPEPEEKPEEVHEDVPPEPEPEPEPQEDFDVDDLDLPRAVEASSLNPVGSVDMDPLMQVYLEQLKKIIMSNFKPPKDLKVGRDAKTTVQFQVDRFGGITAVILKRSDELFERGLQGNEA